MNLKVLRHLLWKDARTVRPLIVSAIFAIVGFYLLLFLYAKSTDRFTEQTTLAYVIWILVPNLFAFSIPAFLVGGEEESGSLAWLKTLPADWKAITLSKFVLSVAYTIVVWVLSTFALSLFWLTIPENLIEYASRTGGIGDLSGDWWFHVMGQSAFTLALLLASMITAYIFRSPIAALVMVLPAIVFLLIAYGQMVASVIGSAQPPLAWGQWFGLIAIYALGIGMLLLIKMWAAYRRLVAPESNLRHRLSVTSDAKNAYRPPHATINAAGHFLRPSPGAALLWQQLRQTLWPLLALTLAACVGIVLSSIYRFDNNEGALVILAVNVAIVSAISIPCFAFYGDGSRGRSQFFADRGISPTLIWLTRIAPPLVCGVILLVTFVVIQWQSNIPYPEFGMIVGLAIVGYATCQFISQWVTRATLGFFAAPAGLCIAGLTFAILLDPYPRWAPVLLVSAIVLFFGSWRLTGSWMARPSRSKTDWRFMLYAALAIVLPYLIVLGSRWATMPMADTAWRQRMANFAFEQQEEPPVSIVAQLGYSNSMDPSQALITFNFAEQSQQVSVSPPRGNRVRNHSLAESLQRDEDFHERVERELAATRSLGEHVSFQELIWTLNSEGTLDGLSEEESIAAALRSARVFVKWANLAREEAVAGRVTFRTLDRSGEQAERIAVQLLGDLLQRCGRTPEIEELCNALPSTELVKRSRCCALVTEWNSGNGSQCFGEYRTVQASWSNFLETPRAKRYAEKAIKLVTDRWGSGTDLSSSDIARLADDLAGAGIKENPVLHLKQYDLAKYGLLEMVRSAPPVSTKD
ncbi:MAG: ABC transporter permease [Planctomycetota bacterium]